jgi:hypothetical protein
MPAEYSLNEDDATEEEEELDDIGEPIDPDSDADL